MLGQSRAAIVGGIPALIVLVLLWVRRPRNRYLALLGIGFLIVVQWAVLVNVFPAIGVGTDDATPEALGLSRRDERTTGQRFDIWRSAFDMIADYPLTGVGMARFRYRPVRNDYPVPEFDYPANPEDTIFRRRLIPHAHNVLVQIATDLGIPGLIVFIGWNTAAAYMVVMVWQRGDRPQKIVVTGVSLGLLAQLVYSMGDAIPLWDRFSFIYWLLLGIIAAQYRLIQAQQID